jgi:hypothetical protein
MSGELSRARKELEKFAGNDVPVADAVLIMGRATGLRIHLLKTDEVPLALAHARMLIKNGKVLEGPFGVKNEIVRASDKDWNDLSGEARALVGTLWAPEVNSDMVVTTVDIVQPKEKVLDTIANILQQKAKFPLGSRGKATS